MNGEARVRIVLLDDHGLVREGLEMRLVSDLPGADIVYSGESLSQAVSFARSGDVDCAIVDLDLGDGTPVTEVVSSFVVHGVPVVIVSAMAQAEALQIALAAGASAFISKRAGMGELTAAVKAAIRGESTIPSDLAREMMRTSSGVELTVQERRVLTLYASGMTIDMVARRMSLSPHTVKDYLDRVRDKYTEAGMAARTKLELNVIARQEGLLPGGA